MALSIGVSRGSVIRVGDEELHVVSIQSRGSMTVEFRGQQYNVTDQERVELMEDTFVSCGLSAHDPNARHRLAFEAPNHVRIKKLPAS
ncbi:hypothetical protein WK13_34780 [Burkholderia ubonensis]|uniref:hypothetical protein n=1 Tax=Burkholderia ubonensis TaxID=101571 RepID=UPI000758E649|nr:hypothetical protein [Burkholderia ubonensis]KVR21706.1 hypothetical protein WK13_34780 [Burkholderia ubonensis]